MIHRAIAIVLALAAGPSDAQDTLGQDVWKWRAEMQPATTVPMDRATG